MTIGKSQLTLEEISHQTARLKGEDLRGHIARLSDRGLITFSNDIVNVGNRLILAEGLMKDGLSAEKVSEQLSWREFEQFSRRALEECGFMVRSNLRFSQSGKRYEIDLVGIKRPYVLFVDCKHWRPGRSASFKEASRKQRERMDAALRAGVIPRFEGKPLRSIRAIPILISLVDAGKRIFERTPVVPIFRVNSFLLGLDELWDELSDDEEKMESEDRTDP